jgi:UDP-3-O-[3-hydroxymyristoyl] glucosamine N-acyltransferase
MKVPLSQLAALVGGDVVGDADAMIEKSAPLHTADEHSITFAEKPEKLDWNLATSARAVVLPKGRNAGVPESFAQLLVDDPKAAFEAIAAFFHPHVETIAKGVSDKAYVAPTAKLGRDVSIGPFATIGDNVSLGDGVKIYPGVVLMANVVVGANTTIFPNAVVYENCRIGADCILHANCVLGAYGFGYDSSSGEHLLTSQYGSVVVGDNVEIGACATIDRASYDATYIGDGTKIDNHVMIAHNCKIGNRNMLCASSGVAGSVATGDYVVMAGRVGVRDHITIGTGAVLGAMAGVMSSVPDNAKIVGIPATPEKEQMRKQVALSRLPDTQKEVRALRKEMTALQARLDALAPTDRQ